MPRMLLRVLCAVMLSALLAANIAPALSEGVEAYAYTYSLKIYEKPSKKSEVIDITPFAGSVTKLAEKKGWAQVRLSGGAIGYCNAKQLTGDDPNIYNTTVYSQQNRAPIYQRPSVDAPLIGHLDRNEKAKMVAMTPMGDWLRILKGDHYGYIQRPRVDYNKFSEGQAAWISAGSADIYYDPAIDATFGSAKQGQTVLLVSVDGGWAKIRSGSGLVGYCKASAVTTNRP